MQNWEVVKKKISEMNKEEIIELVDKLEGSYLAKILFDIEHSCKKRNCYKFNYECKKCMREFWEEEYQPPKQEAWIIHRTLRKKGIEVYLGITYSDQYWINYLDGRIPTTTKKESAYKYTYKEAVDIRDELNKTRVGKQYLWVISKVEE